MTMPITFVSDCSIEMYTKAKERENSRKHEQATCVPITFIDGTMINLIKTQKNRDGQYLEEMKTFKRINLTPNKQGYTPERHPTTKQKVGKTELNYGTDDINSGKTGESFVSNELIKSLTPACDSSESDNDFDKAFQPLIINSNRELKHATFLSHGRTAEVYSFPILLVFTLPHLYF